MFKEQFIEETCRLFKIHPRDLVGPYRYQFLMPARFALAKALRLRGWTLPDIGKLMNRDHTSVIYQIQRAEYDMERNPGYAAKVQHLVELKMETSE